VANLATTPSLEPARLSGLTELIASVGACDNYTPDSPVTFVMRAEDDLVAVARTKRQSPTLRRAVPDFMK
jgi:hypothetical protein